MVLHLEYYRIVQAGCKLLGLKYSPRNVSFFSLKKIIYLSAVLGLCRCPGFSLVVASEGYSPAVTARLVSHCGAQVPGHRDFSACSSQVPEHRLNSRGARAYLLRGMWDLPRAGIKLVSPALASGFFITELPGKPRVSFLDSLLCRH